MDCHEATGQQTSLFIKVKRHARDLRAKKGAWPLNIPHIKSHLPRARLNSFQPIPAEINKNYCSWNIYIEKMCRHLTKTYGCGHKLRTTSPTSSICMGIRPKIHPSGSEFSYRKFEKEETFCPTCTALEEHGRVRRPRASEPREPISGVVEVQEAAVKVSILFSG